MAPADDIPPGDDEALVLETLYYEVLARGQTSSLADTTEVVIRSGAEWEEYRNKLDTPSPIRPVDFSQEMVVLIAIPAATGGYEIDLASIDRYDNGEILVSYVVEEPTRDCLNPDVRSTPFVAAIVRPAPGAVRFEHTTEQSRCRSGLW